MTCWSMCGATPNHMSHITSLENDLFIPKPDTLSYGLSPLHSCSNNTNIIDPERLDAHCKNTYRTFLRTYD